MSEGRFRTEITWNKKSSSNVNPPLFHVNSQWKPSLNSLVYLNYRLFETTIWVIGRVGSVILWVWCTISFTSCPPQHFRWWSYNWLTCTKAMRKTQEVNLRTLLSRDFSKHFLLPLFGGKNSILNWVSKLNPPSFIISLTHISLQLSKFYF